MKAERLAGSGVLGILGAILLFNLAFVVRHCDQLRPVAHGDSAPPVALPRADGRGNLGLADLRGKVVLVDFWATWCGPCAQTMPALERLYRRHRGAGLEILSVNTDLGRSGGRRAQAYAAERSLTFPIVLDDGSAGERYRVESIPHMVIVDKQGVVRDTRIGLVSVDRLEHQLDDEIRKLLAE